MKISHYQQGYSTLMMIMVIFTVSLLLLFSFEEKKQLLHQQNRLQRHYYQYYHAAMSSLEWAGQQQWHQPTQYWQCQLQNEYQFNACIKQSQYEHFILVKGTGGFVTLYLLSQYDDNAQKLIKNGQRWLDYCPQKQGCDDA